MKKVLLTVAACAVASFAADGAAIYNAKCVSCHGKDGKMTAIPGVAIAGQSVGDVEKKLKGYQDGSFGGAKKGMMAPNAKALSADDVKAVASYIASLKK